MDKTKDTLKIFCDMNFNTQWWLSNIWFWSNRKKSWNLYLVFFHINLTILTNFEWTLFSHTWFPCSLFLPTQYSCQLSFLLLFKFAVQVNGIFTCLVGKQPSVRGGSSWVRVRNEYWEPKAPVYLGSSVWRFLQRRTDHNRHIHHFRRK